ncbi:Osmolarity sensor protein EnvZ [Pseudovibrio axinellae]|uniref:histidine kinase n=1 Tax=Pseudovibrio axinellae TaxID=989403 RepID=A0A165T3S5_9HYPH|nr:HAMP domain-containing sensor histidine kinase [Pseudovibrio axinellae]KZL05388.1 Osmolarity sensor protein EnvZ [Pseudovibrio axinellae]SEQ01403.1 Signal transduction histidine kinase [Pseudovibrio axinellae]
MRGLILSLLPRSLERRMVVVLFTAVLCVFAVLGLTLNAYNTRELALAQSFEAGTELSQYLRTSTQGETAPAPYAGRYLQAVEASTPATPDGASSLLTSIANDGAPLKATLVFEGTLPLADLITRGQTEPIYQLDNLGAFVESVTRQDKDAQLYLALPNQQGVRLITFPKLWQNRMTEPVLFILAALCITLVFVLARSLVHYTSAPFRSLAKYERAELKPWDTEEAVALQDTLVREQEARAQLLEEQKRMLASISHDLRTPATRLRLRLEQIESTTLRNRMLHDVEEMTLLIAASLDFLRFNALLEEPQHLSLAALLQSLCDDYMDTGNDVVFVPQRHKLTDQSRNIFGGGGEVELEVEGRAVMSGQPTALRRAFSNLIDNALKYGGAATVEMQNLENDQLLISISDPGPGIPDHLHEKVFEPFFRNDSVERTRSSSVGLGLSIVKQIINAHGSEISLGETPEGKFCIFVKLPREL